MNAQLIFENDLPKIRINGKKYDPLAFMTYKPEEEQLSGMRENGLKLFSFSVSAGDNGLNDYANVHAFSRPVFVGENTFDFSSLDRMLDLAAPAGSEAFVFPRIYLDAPRWWMKKHPEALEKAATGETYRQSFASETWRQAMWEVLKAIIDHVNEGAHKEQVIGYHVAFGGTEECVYQVPHNDDSVGYSDAFFEKYRQWLKERGRPAHKQIPTPFQRRFCTNGVLRDPEKERAVLDFYEFYSELVTDTIGWFCKKIKAYSGNTLLTGAFYGYILGNYDLDKGHNAIASLLKCNELDFVASTNGPSDTGSSWPFSVPVDSFRLHKKLWIAEGDIRTDTAKTLSEGLPEADCVTPYYALWPMPATREEAVSAVTKAAARTLCAHTGIWWFDMFGDWFASPETQAVIRQNIAWNRAQTAGPMHAEIALFIDETGMLYYGGSKPALLQYAIPAQRGEMMRMGAPYDAFVLSDILEPDFPASRYKLCVFLTAVAPAPEVARAIETRLKKDGRTLLWVHLADIFHAGGEKLTDFSVRYDPADEPKQATYELHKFKPDTPWHSAVTFPPVPLSCGRFALSANAYTLATFTDSAEPALQLKCVYGEDGLLQYQSVYSLLPCLPADLLRELAAFSGVHIYNDTCDCVFAGGRFAALHAVNEGYHRLYLPEKAVTATDACTGEMPEVLNHSIDFLMQAGQTRVFCLDFEEDV